MEHVYNAEINGDLLAIETIERVGFYLGKGISSLAGRVCGIDDKFYVPAAYDTRLRAWLPRWAYLFKLWSEKHAYRPMTGEQAFAVLAAIEQRHGTLA